MENRGVNVLTGLHTLKQLMKFLGPKLFGRAESQLLGWVSYKVQVNLSCSLGLVIIVLCPAQWACNCVQLRLC